MSYRKTGIHQIAGLTEGPKHMRKPSAIDLAHAEIDEEVEAPARLPKRRPKLTGWQLVEIEPGVWGER